MKLHSETPEEYLRWCREQVKEQKELIESLRSLTKPELEEYITEQYAILQNLIYRYESAKKGNYEQT